MRCAQFKVANKFPQLEDQKYLENYQITSRYVPL